MLTLRHFTVIPRLPPALERLRDLAYNLWWSWAPVGQDLFIRVDRDLWEAVHGNPIELLARIDQERLNELATDDAFTSHLEAAWQTFQRYMQREGWFSRTLPRRGGRAHRVLLDGVRHPRVLADLLGRPRRPRRRSPQDVERPRPAARRRRPRLRRGVFPAGPQHGRLAGRALSHQRLASHAGLPGARRERQAPHHPRDRTRKGSSTRSSGRCRSAACRFTSSTRTSRRTPPPIARSPARSTAAIRSFASARRSCSGIGGLHALEALGLSPTVCHMNEGHSAFLAIERIGRVMRDRGVSFHVAAEANSPANVFTTHTPVPAGNDAFQPDLARKYLEPYRAPLGISETEMLGLGRIDPRRSGVAVLDARPRDPHVGPLQRREQAARRGVAQDVARPLAGVADARGPHRVDHQRRAHRLVGRVGDGRALHALPRPALGGAVRRRRALGAHRRDPRRRALAGARAPPASPRPARAPLAASRGGAARRPSRRPRAGRRGARPARADDRLRAALRDVQARDAPLHATPSA